MIGMDATAMSPAPPSSSEDVLLRALSDRGWHFKDMDRIRGLIKDQLSLPNSVCTVDSIESELLNMDLRSIGGKCLPEPSVLRKTPHLQGPMVLQVCSSRDISRSCLDGASGNSGSRRLLRLELTDGHSRITAIEYSHVPSVPHDVIPGTKVQLRNKAYICSGILCLNEKVIAILGGIVQSLYEEWKMKRKYLDVSRHTLGLSQENASSCPPPFEKLDIRARVERTGATKGKYCSSGTTEFSGSASNEIRQSLAAKGECSSLNRTSELQKINASVDSATDDRKLLHTVGENKDKPTCSSARSKGVA
ncbi:UNVERIFIED_CONTAM: Tudor domain-containing protein 3 [Sesamum latifolium]|uniref:Tudor domain-containing protein 3 n=1 Tax=Sesamum latifolium TaxID=2727402 RepID=A0AAW2XF60_9LAMI